MLEMVNSIEFFMLPSIEFRENIEGDDHQILGEYIPPPSFGNPGSDLRLTVDWFKDTLLID